MFGVRWGTGAFTVDPNFPHAGKSISLAIASNITIDTAKAIDSLEMGFIPVERCHPPRPRLEATAQRRLGRA